MSTVYTKASDYIGSTCDLDEKIQKVNNIINALLDLSITAVENEIYEEYQLDDGQSVIKARYKGLSAILAGIKGYEAIKQLYINQKYGRVTTLVDAKNFPGRCY